MRIGPARLAKVLEAEPMREVSVAEARSTERDRLPAVKKIRDYHHNIARCAALGMRAGEIGVALGMNPSRVQVLIDDPAFQELISHYRDMVDETWKQNAVGVFGVLLENHARAQRLIAAQLEDAEDQGKEIPLGTLAKVAGDLADRVGFSKHSIVTVDNSFAAKLDRAIDRSTKVIEGSCLSPPLAVGEVSPGEVGSVSSPGERRRA